MRKYLHFHFFLFHFLYNDDYQLFLNSKEVENIFSTWNFEIFLSSNCRCELFELISDRHHHHYHHRRMDKQWKKEKKKHSINSWLSNQLSKFHSMFEKKITFYHSNWYLFFFSLSLSLSHAMDSIQSSLFFVVNLIHDPIKRQQL